MPNLGNRLRRIEGQVGGTARMVAQDSPCVDVLTQVHACRAALNAVGVQLLTAHLAQMVLDARQHGAALGNDDLESVRRAIAELVGAHPTAQSFEMER